MLAFLYKSMCVACETIVSFSISCLNDLIYLPPNTKNNNNWIYFSFLGWNSVKMLTGLGTPIKLPTTNKILVIETRHDMAGMARHGIFLINERCQISQRNLNVVIFLN